MEFAYLLGDQFSEMQDMAACSLCALEPPTTLVVTACGHCFCWSCMHKFLQGQAKPCPVCTTMLSSPLRVTPTFDTLDSMVLCLPASLEVEPKWNGIDVSGTAAFAPTAALLSEEPSAGKDAAVSADEEQNSKAMKSVFEF